MDMGRVDVMWIVCILYSILSGILFNNSWKEKQWAYKIETDLKQKMNYVYMY